MFVFLLLCGRYLEIRARHTVARSLDFLSRAIPEVALRLDSAGKSEQVAVSALRRGDLVLVRSGERIPADGVVKDGRSIVDESLLTGESSPVARQTGDRLTGGSTNVADPLLMQVERIGADTVLSSIVRLMQQAATDRPRMVANAERITGWFVAATLASRGRFGRSMVVDRARSRFVGGRVYPGRHLPLCAVAGNAGRAHRGDGPVGKARPYCLSRARR